MPGDPPDALPDTSRPIDGARTSMAKGVKAQTPDRSTSTVSSSQNHALNPGLLQQRDKLSGEPSLAFQRLPVEAWEDWSVRLDWYRLHGKPIEKIAMQCGHRLVSRLL